MNIDNDLPPKHTIDGWSDREFLDRLYQVRVNSTCTEIAQKSYMYLRQGRISEEDKQLADGFYTVCMTSYMDKNFHECMRKRGVNDPPKVMTDEFIGALDGKRMRPKNESAIQECLSQWSASIGRLAQRNSIEADATKVNTLYSEFIDMANRSKTIIYDNDTQEDAKTKFNQVNNSTCQSYQVIDQRSVPDDKMIEYGQQYTNYGICLTANLCADRLKACLSTGKSFRECMIFQNDTDLVSCTMKLDEAWHGKS